ncbi:MAG: alpha/beta hydrolase, partial [Vicinamibacterales bacterium]
AAACASPVQPNAIDRLQPCAGDAGPTDAFCGTLRVFEQRDLRAGRAIDLHIVVLPALGRDAKPDPLFFLAGGPGQGAARMAQQVRELFRQVQSDRDIVLVDQRGTGRSNALDCKSEDESLRALNAPIESTLAELRTCLARLDADPRFYTTPIAMDDLDDVRAHLGYARINLYGGSYGTRAALVYMRQHPARVRAAVLDGVAPMDMSLPLFFARDVQRAFDRLLEDCEIDAGCRQHYPGLTRRAAALFERLRQKPAKVRLIHPRRGAPEELSFDASVLANVIAGTLYSPLISSLLPELLARAEADDFQGLITLLSLNDPALENMSVGMQLSVLCAEDLPRVGAADAARRSAATLFAPLVEARLRACESWPTGVVPPDYHEPVVSAIPTLVLSGDLDPVTPPSWGESVAKHLRQSRHLVMPATGHGVLLTGCGRRLVREFLEQARADGLDTKCVNVAKRPPFFLSPAGPDPARVTSVPIS